MIRAKKAADKRNKFTHNHDDYLRFDWLRFQYRYKLKHLTMNNSPMSLEKNMKRSGPRMVPGVPQRRIQLVEYSQKTIL